jgi:hypothetical protein
MLEKYQFLSTDWLLFGKGSMYKENKMQNLFGYDPGNSRETNEILTKSEQIRPEIDFQNVIKNKAFDDSIAHTEKTVLGVVKIVWFYENNSFEEFIPRR